MDEIINITVPLVQENNELTIKYNGKKYKFRLFLDNIAISLFSLMNREEINAFEFTILGKTGVFKGNKGNHALWLPTESSRGIKVIFFKNRDNAPNYDRKLLDVIKHSNSPIFPKIYWHGKGDSFADGERRVYVIEMERMSNKVRKPKNKKARARKGLENPVLPECSVKLSNLYRKEFERLNLWPDDVWYKKVNIVGAKIVDFHGFQIKPERYKMPSKVGQKQLYKIYQNAPRWRTGKPQGEAVDNRDTMYHGYKFNCGYEFEGYKSNGKSYDTYLKLPFIPMNDVKNGNVLDIGSNQGFFTFQSVIHGAKSVTSIEYEEKHFNFTTALNRECFKFDNITFLNMNAVDYVNKCEHLFDVVMCLSVVHQIYPSFEGAEEFMTNLSNIAKKVVFESPIMHKLNQKTLKETYHEMFKYFKIVRLLYSYMDYSGSERAIFSCYGKNNNYVCPSFI